MDHINKSRQKLIGDILSDVKKELSQEEISLLFDSDKVLLNSKKNNQNIEIIRKLNRDIYINDIILPTVSLNSDEVIKLIKKYYGNIDKQKNLRKTRNISLSRNLVGKDNFIGYSKTKYEELHYKSKTIEEIKKLFAELPKRLNNTTNFKSYRGFKINPTIPIMVAGNPHGLPKSGIKKKSWIPGIAKNLLEKYKENNHEYILGQVQNTECKKQCEDENPINKIYIEQHKDDIKQIIANYLNIDPKLSYIDPKLSYIDDLINKMQDNLGIENSYFNFQLDNQTTNSNNHEQNTYFCLEDIMYLLLGYYQNGVSVDRQIQSNNTGYKINYVQPDISLFDINLFYYHKGSWIHATKTNDLRSLDDNRLNVVGMQTFPVIEHSINPTLIIDEIKKASQEKKTNLIKLYKLKISILMKFLKDYHGIKTLISLEPDNSYEKTLWESDKEYKYYNFYVKDMHSFTLQETIFIVYQILANDDVTNGNIGVHCYAGYGRTGFFIFMYYFTKIIFQLIEDYIKNLKTNDEAIIKANKDKIIDVFTDLFSGDYEFLYNYLNQTYPNYFSFESNSTPAYEVFKSQKYYDKFDVILRNQRLNAFYLAIMYWIKYLFSDNKELVSFLSFLTKIPVNLNVYNHSENFSDVITVGINLDLSIIYLIQILTTEDYILEDFININDSKFLSKYTKNNEYMKKIIEEVDKQLDDINKSIIPNNITNILEPTKSTKSTKLIKGVGTSLYNSIIPKNNPNIPNIPNNFVNSIELITGGSKTIHRLRRNKKTKKNKILYKTKKTNRK